MKTIALLLISLIFFTCLALAAEMDMVSVDSSLLDKVGYDSATKTLVIQVVNSSDIYTYLDVPENLYDRLLAADSKGKFYVDKIKGKYERGK